MTKPASTALGLLFLANLLLFPGIGRAQATDAAETRQDGAAAEAERVIVTGSIIPTAEEVGPNPVVTITLRAGPHRPVTPRAQLPTMANRLKTRRHKQQVSDCLAGSGF